MLYAPLGEGKPTRVQGCFISNEEIEAVIARIKETSTAEYSEEILEHIEQQAEQVGNNKGGSSGTNDPATMRMNSSRKPSRSSWTAVRRPHPCCSAV